jgi:hypothetical protein
MPIFTGAFLLGRRGVVSSGLEEAKGLARRAFGLLLCKLTGALTEEERKTALKGLERLFPEEPFGEELERLEEESRLRRAVRKAFIPPLLPSRRREGAENQEVVERTGEATEKELKVKISANPSLFGDLCALAFKLAERGCAARLKVFRVRDLALAKLLPPLLLGRLGDRVVRLDLEVSPR